MIIRPITTLEKINEVPKVDSAIWGKGSGSTLPTHILLAIAKNGGLLSGAYIDEKLVGFTLGWLGRIDSRNTKLATQHLKLVSHMNGVLPEYRDQQIGYQLKLAQREWALAQGLELITWTFDPLESRNARLNLRLLGATSQTYLRNVYGEMSDQINIGIASDRFQVDWRIGGTHVQNRLAPTISSPLPTLANLNAELLNQATLKSNGYLYPIEIPEKPSKESILIEIPADMQAIRQADIALGIAWRMHTRSIFESAFKDDYQVADFIYEKNTSPPRSFYLLTKGHNQ